MNALTKLALGAMGRLRPTPAKGDTIPKITLPAPDKIGGIPLMEAIAKRLSAREFAPRELPLALLSCLLWAANGVNRGDGGRTAPSAMNAQEIDVYVMSRCHRAPIRTMPPRIRCDSWPAATSGA